MLMYFVGVISKAGIFTSFPEYSATESGIYLPEESEFCAWKI
jgi:hypothetical protein